jgi:hypothetical protein
VEEGWRETGQAIHAHCFHISLFFSVAQKTVKGRMRSKASGALSPRPDRGDGCFRSLL